MHGRLGSKLRDKTRQDFQGVRRAVNVIALLVVVIGTNPTQATHTVLAPPGSSCDEACGRLQRVCRPESLDQVNSNASIHIAAQKAIQHLFHSDGNTGLWAHYRPSSFDEPSKIWRDISGSQRDSSPASGHQVLTTRVDIDFWESSASVQGTISGLPDQFTGVELSVNVSAMERPSGAVEVVVGGKSLGGFTANEIGLAFPACKSYDLMSSVWISQEDLGAVDGSFNIFLLKSSMSVGGSWDTASGDGYCNSHEHFFFISALVKAPSTVGNVRSRGLNGHGATSVTPSVTGGQRDWMDLVDIPPEFSMCTVSLLFGSEGRVFNSAGHWRHGHVEEHAGHVDYAVTKPIDSPVCTNRTCFTIRTMGGYSMSQQTVQAHCAEYGESLAILKSAEEVDLVKNLIKTAHYDSAFWVGATSSSPDFKLRWDDDTEVDTSLFGPNHVATELIGSLWFRAYDFAWGVHTSPPGCCTYIPRGGICQRVGTLFSVD